MPSLPRIRRTRPGTGTDPARTTAERRPLELSAGALTWLHLDRPSEPTALELADRFGWHALDVEDVLS
jgi:Mg2+ and Co2+ transporter CorA